MNKYVISLSLLCTLAPCAYGMEGDVADVPSSPQDIPVAAVAPEIKPSATMQKQASAEVIDEPAQPASEAQPTETIPTTKRSRIQETAKKFAALAGYVVYSPVRAGRYVWNSRPCTTVVSLPGKAILRTKTAAKSAGHKIAHLLRTIFGKPNFYQNSEGTWKMPGTYEDVQFTVNLRDLDEQGKPVHKVQQRMKREFIIDLRQALDEHGRLVHNAQKYVLRRTFGISTLTALIGSASAYRVFGKNPKTVVAGLLSGISSGIISSICFNRQANMSEVYSHAGIIAQQALINHMTGNDAREAFGNSDHSLRHVGLSGLNAMCLTKDTIIELGTQNRARLASIPACPIEEAASSAE